MKKSLTLAVVSVFVIASCNNSTTNSSTATDTTANASGTTTVTTTTRTYSGTFTPQPNVRYIDLKTHKEVIVRIDTVRGSVVNAETNEPIYLFVAPGSTDTFYGATGNVANGHITEDASGNYDVDATMSGGNSNTDATTNTTDNTTTTTTDETGDVKKYKATTNGKEKLKTDDEKIKVKGDKEKIKAK